MVEALLYFLGGVFLGNPQQYITGGRTKSNEVNIKQL